MAEKIKCEVCGKEFLDARGIRMHMEMHKRKDKTEQIEQKEVIMTEEKVKEVEIKPEKDVVEKKKEVKTVDFNSCGECGQTFKGNPNFCPKCGTEFE